MSKHRQHDATLYKKSLSFIDFWSFVSSQVGNCKLDINASANHLDHLFPEHAAHPEYLKSMIISTLTNRHGKLNQNIDLNVVLDALGDTAFHLRQRANDDLFDIELLEEIAWHIAERFHHLVNIPAGAEFIEASGHSILPNTHVSGARRATASVVSLNKYRTHVRKIRH